MSTVAGGATDPGARRRSGPWKVAGASMIGTSVEWYDFGIYATAAALVFPELFFPEMNRALGTLMSFATLFVGSLGRPLGAVVFGHIGDRYGRKRALIWSMTLMGGATFCIGLLPGYASIGVAAPLLLVLIRMVQSLAVGGEWGGAVLFAVEHAPPRRRAFFGSFPQVGDGVGYFMSTGVFALAGLAGHDALVGWAWRLPFLLSAVLVLVGLVIRSSIEESPEFEAARRAEAAEEKQAAPLVAVVRDAWKTWLLASGAFLITVGGYYVVVTFMSTYAVTELGFTDSQVAGRRHRRLRRRHRVHPAGGAGRRPPGAAPRDADRHPVAPRRGLPDVLARRHPFRARTLARDVPADARQHHRVRLDRHAHIRLVRSSGALHGSVHELPDGGAHRHAGPGGGHLAVQRRREFMDPRGHCLRCHGAGQRGLSRRVPAGASGAGGAGGGAGLRGAPSREELIRRSGMARP